MSFEAEEGVRSEKQHSMRHGTHKAWASFDLNGVVPPPLHTFLQFCYSFLQFFLQFFTIFHSFFYRFLRSRGNGWWIWRR